MELRIRSKKTAIVLLDREGLLALAKGNYEAVCESCGAVYNETVGSFFASIGPSLSSLEMEGEDLHWNSVWVGVRKSDGGVIGAIRMMGTPTEKRELTIALFPFQDYEDPSFSKLFVKVCEWAFNHRTVYYLRVVPGDDREEVFLRYYGFVPHQTDGFFEREKNRPAWVLICLCMGLSTGVALGDLFGSSVLGLAVGALFGVFVGFLLDRQDISRRKLK